MVLRHLVEETADRPAVHGEDRRVLLPHAAPIPGYPAQGGPSHPVYGRRNGYWIERRSAVDDDLVATRRSWPARERVQPVNAHADVLGVLVNVQDLLRSPVDKSDGRGRDADPGEGALDLQPTDEQRPRHHCRPGDTPSQSPVPLTSFVPSEKVSHPVERRDIHPSDPIPGADVCDEHAPAGGIGREGVTVCEHQVMGRPESVVLVRYPALTQVRDQPLLLRSA